jgi:hypothetical protein
MIDRHNGIFGRKSVSPCCVGIEEGVRRRTGAYAQIAYNYSDEVVTSEQEEQEEKQELITDMKPEGKAKETQTIKPQASEPPTEEPFVLPKGLPQADGFELVSFIYVMLLEFSSLVKHSGTNKFSV